MEEYVEERNNRFNNVKIKGRIMRNQGLKMHNFGKSEKPDHTRDYGKRSGKVNERIARMLRKNERNEGINNIVVDDEYEETIELEQLREQALEESQAPQLQREVVTEKINAIENMEQEEKELLQRIQQLRLQRGKEKLKLLANGENTSILFEEWEALEEQILAKAKNHNLGGVMAWKEYRYSPYDDKVELKEYAIRLQNQLLHIYQYADKIQAELEQLTEERKASLERKATKDSKTDGAIGWKRILGNQYSLEEVFDIDKVIGKTQDSSEKLSYFEKALEDSIANPEIGEGTRESVEIILGDIQNSNSSDNSER
ncbi:MAG: hypothetical protein ACLUT6_04775 [Clostridia bacterium]